MNTDTKFKNRQQLITLLRSFLPRLGGNWTADFPDFDQLVSIPALTIDLKAGDITFVIVHSNATETAELFLLECRFGKVPKSREPDAYTKLLDLNYQISGLNPTGYAIDESNDEVVYTHTCFLGRMDALSLIELISGIAALAVSWRRNFFIDAKQPNVTGRPITAKSTH